MMASIEALRSSESVTSLCSALGLPRSSLYRHRCAAPAKPRALREPSPRALNPAEKAAVRALLNSPRFEEAAPREVYATLLDEGEYYCSWRTMYRILAAHDEVRERRNQLRHPAYSKPELLATGPKQVWSWDITKLRGPSKGRHYYLYVILDIFSRYVVGWMIAEQEAAVLAEHLIVETCTKQDIAPGHLTIHADNGPAMTAKPVALLMADLGVVKSHSRPHVSDDNPFSEAQFKTLKYYPGYPERFGSLSDARAWARRFFDWYNNAHHHTGLGLLTPADVHLGRAEAVLGRRQAILQQAYQAHPERFVKGAPEPQSPPTAVWINPPKERSHGQPTPTEPAEIEEEGRLAVAFPASAGAAPYSIIVP
jgi:putative transposase